MGFLILLAILACLSLAAFLLELSERRALNPFDFKDMADLLREDDSRKVFHRKVKIYFHQLQLLIESGANLGPNNFNRILQRRKRILYKSLLWLTRIVWSAPVAGGLCTAVMLANKWQTMTAQPIEYFWDKFGIAVRPLLLGLIISIVSLFVFLKRKVWVQSDIEIMEAGTKCLSTVTDPITKFDNKKLQ